MRDFMNLPIHPCNPRPRRRGRAHPRGRSRLRDFRLLRSREPQGCDEPTFWSPSRVKQSREPCAYAVAMGRLYAATGEGIARLDEVGDAWTVELSLPGSGAQCLAVDPDDPDSVYAGLRKGGVRRTVDGGRTSVDCRLPD